QRTASGVLRRGCSFRPILARIRMLPLSSAPASVRPDPLFLSREDSRRSTTPACTPPSFRDPFVSIARRQALCGCAIVTLALVVGLPTLRADNYFLGDDFGLVHHLYD